MNPIISIIAAVDQNYAIGNNKQLLCYLPTDLKRFKTLTTGHTIVMGRKTWESLPNGALPNRQNVVLSRNKSYSCKNCKLFHSVDEVLEYCKAKNEIFIIGGAEIYKLFLPFTQKLYLTHIQHQFIADSHFPEILLKQWKLIEKHDFPADNKNKFVFTFANYKRI